MVHDLIDLSCIRHSPVQAEIVKRHTAGEIPRAEVVLDSLGRRCLYSRWCFFFFLLAMHLAAQVTMFAWLGVVVLLHMILAGVSVGLDFCSGSRSTAGQAFFFVPGGGRQVISC